GPSAQLRNRLDSGRSLGKAGPVTDLARELAARRIDVVATRATHRGHDAGIDQDARKGPDPLPARSVQSRSRERIERNQVELAGDVGDQPEKRPRMGIG